ncbi:MAG TPA: hypothetical protein ENH99_01220 [Candidatus Pacearchaeota archaeon]|nr:hypothetical protein [Candidatus Pacearchaeota archaeon]
MADRNKLLVTFLVLVIVILVAIVAFTFLIKPAVTGYVVDKQIGAQNVLLNNIIAQAAQCQTVTLPFGNQTINLVALECLQQGQQQAQQPVQ